MRQLSPLAAVLAASLLLGPAPEARSQTPVPRPRLGLVLSGGGARGAAHVGVLKVLEELRVPVDLITGTSMGSAVGGLYATGLTAPELESIFTRFDWLGAFTDSPPRRELSFRRKEDDRTFLVKARIGLAGGQVRLPRGFVEGQNFVMELRKLAHITQSIPSFDQLPIPFRAMATDLETARPVVLDKGDLAMAIRASISVAPLFSPAQIDGRLLVDGGYLRNVPVNTAREMGAERLIAVNIGTPLSSAKDLASVLDVVSQVGRLGGQVQDRRQLSEMGLDDLLIEPDMEGLTFTDFGKIPEIIARGEAAARAVAERLKAFAVSEEDYKRWRASLPPGPTLPRVDSIEFRNGTRIADDVFRPFISQKVGAPVDPAGLQTDLARIFGFGYFEFLNYHVAEREGKNVLVIDAPRKSWGPDYLRLGLQIAEEFDGDSVYALKARYQKTELNRLGGEMNLDGDIGTNSRIQAEWHQPIGKAPRWMSYGAPYFTSLQGAYGQENDPVRLSRGSELPFQAVTGQVSPSLGRTLGNWGRAKAGLKWDWETYNTSLARDAGETYSRSDGFLALDIDTLDDAGFPRQGALGILETRAAATALGGESSAALFKGDLGGARSWGPHTLQARAHYGTNLNPEAEVPFLLRLGGFLNLSGYSHNSLVGYESALGQLRWNRRAGALASFPLYLGTALEWGGTWNRRRDITLSSGYWSGSLYAALDSGLGPAYLAYSMSEQSVHTVYFYVGQAF